VIKLDNIKKHLEIEFKTFISKNEYERMLKLFNLEDKVFEQTNYYFDTNDYKLINNKIVLRIRKKEQYKLTKKEKSDNANMESSRYLTDEEAKDMIKNGFDASIIGINNYVKNICSLTTFRAKTPYKNGTLFFDKSVYNGITDYEIEFEADDIENGQKEFDKFLNENSIERKVPVSKSKRAFNTLKK